MNPSTSRLPPSTNASSSGPTDLRLVRRLAPYEGGTPYTKEQIKRRSFWINFAIHGFHFAVWVIFTMWLLNGGGPKL